MTLTVGGQPVTIIPTIEPANATNLNIIWTSSNEAVARVSANGTVTPMGAGTATITGRTEDGNFTVTITIIVNAAELPRTNGGFGIMAFGAALVMLGSLTRTWKEN